MIYNAACSYARAGNKVAALQRLEQLVAIHNFSDAAHMEGDEDLKGLHTDKKWPFLVSAAHQNKLKKEVREKTRTSRLQADTKWGEIVYKPLTPLAQSMVEQDSLPYLSLNSGNFRIFFAADGYAATQLAQVKSELDDALDRAMVVLGLTHWNGGYTVILVNSLDEMALVSGMRVKGGVALPGHDIMVLPYRPERRPQFRHEFFHLMTYDVWGPTASRLLNEGSAVYADDQCHIENPIYNINAQLMKAGKLVALEQLIHNFDDQARQSDVIAYLQSAGIFKYLFEKHGSIKMQQLWKAGFDDFEKIYGQKWSDFETEWLGHIKQLPTAAEVDLELLLKEGCG
jgi:hypothetical protein